MEASSPPATVEAERRAGRLTALMSARSAVSIASPIAIGFGTGHVPLAVTAAIGAMCATLVFVKTRDEPLELRHFGGILFGASGYALGLLVAGSTWGAAALPVLLALASGAFRLNGAVSQISGPQLVMYSLMASGSLHAQQPQWVSMLAFLAGAAWTCALTLLTARIEPVSAQSAANPSAVTVELRPPKGFQPREDPLSFAVLLAGALAAAELLASLLHPERPYWVAMTVVIVLRPSLSLTWRRGISRIAGTIFGVLIGGLALGWITDPIALCLLVAACAAAIPEAARIGYFVQASATTTLVMLFYDAMGLHSDALFITRIVDTLLGCAIVVLVIAAEYWQRRRESR